MARKSRKQSAWNKVVAGVYKQFKGTTVKGKPFSLGDAMKKASQMKKSGMSMFKGTRKTRGGGDSKEGGEGGEEGEAGEGGKEGGEGGEEGKEVEEPPKKEGGKGKRGTGKKCKK
jgi:hypothetical protein